LSGREEKRTKEEKGKISRWRSYVVVVEVGSRGEVVVFTCASGHKAPTACNPTVHTIEWRPQRHGQMLFPCSPVPNAILQAVDPAIMGAPETEEDPETGKKRTEDPDAGQTYAQARMRPWHVNQEQLGMGNWMMIMGEEK
jgi:hypothetical protein